MNSCLDSDGIQASCASGTRRAHVFVAGRVQGVFFRMETQKHAEGLGLTGWVRNLEDRRVEAVFEGGEDTVGKMLDWCREGPALSRVTGVEIVEETPTNNFKDFRIRY
ncbi:MAG: acylphosphatase [Deltaproteobacteria bacterium]|nr:acylphosphatase [Deltaproteobacteria bacterium]